MGTVSWKHFLHLAFRTLYSMTFPTFLAGSSQHMWFLSFSRPLNILEFSRTFETSLIPLLITTSYNVGNIYVLTIPQFISLYYFRIIYPTAFLSFLLKCYVILDNVTLMQWGTAFISQRLNTNVYFAHTTCEKSIDWWLRSFDHLGRGRGCD